jgi:hypothetical protein
MDGWRDKQAHTHEELQCCLFLLSLITGDGKAQLIEETMMDVADSVLGKQWSLGCCGQGDVARRDDGE